ncbi:MAG: hypothetical protein WBD36_07360 [Bacteroidota bacterium]
MRTAIAILIFACMVTGCDKTVPSLAEFDTSTRSDSLGSVSYLELVPPISGFNDPQGLLFGYDQLLYVADTRNNRIVQMDLSGQILSVRAVTMPYAISQDKRLDILASGLIILGQDSIGALFRFKLVQADHDISLAPVETVWTELAHPRRRFTGIGALPDNEFLAVRQGPDNSSFVDPDSRLLRFAASNSFITPVVDLVTQTGTGIRDINQPTGIGLFPNSKSFIILQNSAGMAYGAIWMVYISSSDFEGWQPKFDPAQQEQRSVDFVRPNRFVLPQGAVVDGRRGDVFIADAALDSVVKFDNKGAFKSESFGFSQTQGRMQRPSGLAFYNKTLYVLDAGTNRILLFKLSTDF